MDPQPATSKMLNSAPKLAPVVNDDHAGARQLRSTPLAGPAIPAIDLVLLTLSLTLLVAVFTFGIRI